jgi:hypothetical protein
MHPPEPRPRHRPLGAGHGKAFVIAIERKTLVLGLHAEIAPSCTPERIAHLRRHRKASRRHIDGIDAAWRGP